MSETLKVSEIFDSLQGEGASAGQLSTFLRLAGCNLHCEWCDTRYSWDWANYSYADNVKLFTLAELDSRLASASRLVVTGGEPLLQQAGLAALFALLPATQHIEIETNGTRLPNAALLARVNQWNVSPKLANSGEASERRILPDVLAALRDTGRAYLKLVVSAGHDEHEAQALVEGCRWPPSRVLLMPQARNRADLLLALPRLADTAIALGYGVSPRLHLLMWDGERGR